MTAETTGIMNSQAPARPAMVTMIVATLTATAALVALVGLGLLSGHVLLIPPMAASIALAAGAPTPPLAQPRSVIGGQVISAIVGVLVGLISHSPWAAAIAGGLALGAMLLTRTSHSPVAATVLVVFGLIRSAFGCTRYPQYGWWGVVAQMGRRQMRGDARAHAREGGSEGP